MSGYKKGNHVYGHRRAAKIAEQEQQKRREQIENETHHLLHEERDADNSVASPKNSAPQGRERKKEFFSPVVGDAPSPFNQSMFSTTTKLPVRKPTSDYSRLKEEPTSKSEFEKVLSSIKDFLKMLILGCAGMRRKFEKTPSSEVELSFTDSPTPKR